jgi:Transposase DDE domain
MLEVETFLTWLYVLVDDHVKAISAPMRPPGLAPVARVGRVGRPSHFSVSEVLTLALFSQWAPFASERAFYRFAQRHLRTAFPTLPTRSQFNRALRRHVEWLSCLGPALAAQLGAGTVPYEVLDSTGLPVRNAPRRGSNWLAGQANLGHCTRLGWYYGLHALTCVTPQGVLTGTGLAPASANDHRLADTFLRARRSAHPRLPGVGQPTDGYYVADTGFDRPATPEVWQREYGVRMVSMPYRNQRRWPRALRRWLAGLRQIVETVHDRLLFTFGQAQRRPHTLAGAQARWAAAVALHNACCWFNRRLGRPLLAVADLLAW